MVKVIGVTVGAAVGLCVGADYSSALSVWTVLPPRQSKSLESLESLEPLDYQVKVPALFTLGLSLPLGALSGASDASCEGVTTLRQRFARFCKVGRIRWSSRGGLGPGSCVHLHGASICINFCRKAFTGSSAGFAAHSEVAT